MGIGEEGEAETVGSNRRWRWKGTLALCSYKGCDRTPVVLGHILRRLILAGEPGFLSSLYSRVELKKVKLCTCSFVLSSASEA